ncbi:polysaccharide pyruvyl transferase family protein [Rhodococcus sp. BS-15]|uniref:polysaccharide pyruvyl transferase family protein n=1 Tax=Rhodococcus sp. BS-15 TaxID=1304954 RepID=UPI00165142A8|nr:polysaccharide pyruvyl transferase family protein [Rhodococcus sp. BS-15]
MLITGVNFQNQGAYMMLVAVADQLRQRGIGRPVIDVRWGTSRQKRAEGLSTLVSIDEFGPMRSLFMERFPEKVRDRIPVLTYKSIDAVIDASGFAFGDQWSHARLQARADRFAFFSARGIPVVIMPQAFGPFGKTAKPASTVVSSARLLYARDAESLKFLKTLPVYSKEKVKLATDFTIDLAAREPGSAVDSFVGKVLIVPNINIYSRGNEVDYLDTVKKLVLSFQESGQQVCGLVHDTGRDREIFDLLSDRGCRLPVLEGLDGLQSKWLLGKASAVVSGRFHATVSALSQGVPTVIHGWSHKYEHLAADFDASSLLASPYDSQESLRVSAAMMSDSNVSARLRERKPLLVRGIEEMWNEIESVIKKEGSTRGRNH